MKDKDYIKIATQKVVDYYNESPYASKHNLLVTSGDFEFLGLYTGKTTRVCWFKRTDDNRYVYSVETDFRKNVSFVCKYKKEHYKIIGTY